MARKGAQMPSLEALQSGDAAAMQAALRALLPDVRSWLHRLLGPRPDLDDATQDALVALAQALPTFEGRSSVRTFAHRITVRVAYRYFARRRKREPLALVPPPPDEIDPESRAMDREALRRLHRCLDELPPNRRMAFLLCCVEGLKPSEAAALEGCSPNALRTRLSHARAEVARRLADDPYMKTLARRKR
jgi:RNA polymerase sigma-70 factor (ECF subfamily)